MGLLDDAIREHLELKRQHGADPTEVERQEREALGAPQRAEFAAPPEPEEPAPVKEPFDAEADPPAAVAASEVVSPQAPPEDDAWLDEEREGDVPPEQPLEQPPPGEDVLEETPEFLQETPEHDRLWFEQKPPRDFDFDN